MEFVTIRLGGRDRVFSPQNRVRVPFTLPQPARAVHPILQSLRLTRSDDDMHLRDVQVRLVPFFNSGESTTQGEVEIETTFIDDGGGIIVASRLIELEVAVLVVGM